MNTRGCMDNDADKRPPRGAMAPMLLLLLLTLGAGTASAQQLGDIAGKASLSDAERAKRDADKVYQWIRFNADAAAAKAGKPPAANSKPAAPNAATAAAVPSSTKPRPAAPAPVTPTDAPVTASTAASEAATATLMPALAASAAAPTPELLASLAPSPAAIPVAATPLPIEAKPSAPQQEQPPAGLQLLERIEPEFPTNLLREGRGGSVLVRLQVEANGLVSGTEVLRSSNRRLVPAVLQAVARWRFAPSSRAQSAEVEFGFRSE